MKHAKLQKKLFYVYSIGHTVSFSLNPLGTIAIVYTTSYNIIKSLHFYPQSEFMGFVWFWEKNSNYSPNEH
jgi:hypothetical protein